MANSAYLMGKSAKIVGFYKELDDLRGAYLNELQANNEKVYPENQELWMGLYHQLNGLKTLLDVLTEDMK
jgi:hypothetical protein